MERMKAMKKECFKEKDDVTNGEKKKKTGGLVRKRACVCIMCVM